MDGDLRRHPVWRLVYPVDVGDVAAVRHALPGRMRLALRRRDRACYEAAVSALRRVGGRLGDAAGRDRHEPGGAAGSLVVRYDPAQVPAERLLRATLPALPLPPARVDEHAVAAVPPRHLWAALTAGAGPPWRPPAMLRVQPVAGPPASWGITVDVGTARLPHVMRVATQEAPRLLELVISGKLSAVVRLDLEPVPARGGVDGTRVRARQWFEFAGGALEAAVGGAIVERLTRRFAVEHLASLCAVAERG